MVDLECDGLISEMFQHFINSIRDDHPKNIFKSMETIMTVVLETCEDVPIELLMPILDSLRRKNEVAVALSHAAILEESMRARDQLMEQNVALDLARQEVEMAIRARNDFVAVMNHEMGTPMHAVITLSSLLLETKLTPDQRMMIETVLKSNNLLTALINDILDLSRLENGEGFYLLLV